jgi:hypothetical protein
VILRAYAENRHKAKFRSRERRAVARIEAAPGLDIRFVVTNLTFGKALALRQPLLRARPG